MNDLKRRAGRNRKAPPNLAPLLKGLYRRVARQLGVDPSYVSRVARGERESETVLAALRRELRRIVRRGKQKRGRGLQKPVKKKAAVRKLNTNQRLSIVGGKSARDPAS